MSSSPDVFALLGVPPTPEPPTYYITRDMRERVLAADAPQQIAIPEISESGIYDASLEEDVLFFRPSDSLATTHGWEEEW